MSTIRRTFGAPLERAALNDRQRTVRGDDDARREWFRLVTPAIDRHGTIILPEGVDLTTHRTNPVFLWMHQSSSRGGGLKLGAGADALSLSLPPGAQPPPDVVIGQVVDYEQDATRLDICVEFDDDEMADLCLRKVRKGFLRAVSIGCNVLEETTREIDGVAVPVYARSELLEASLVIIPSNRQALQLDRAAAVEAVRSIEGPLDDDAPDPVVVASAPEERDAVPAPGTGDGPGDADADEVAAAVSGVCVCLYPVAGTVDALAVAGGEPAAEIHVTLAYVPAAGLPDGWEDRLTVLLHRLARAFPILRGTFNGVGRFSGSETSDGQDVVYASPDVPRLAELAARVREDMTWADFKISTIHAWTPHATLAYVAPDAASPVQRIAAQPAVFTSLSFTAGGVRHDFDFVTPDAVSAGDDNDLARDAALDARLAAVDVSPADAAQVLRDAAVDCDAAATLARAQADEISAQIASPASPAKTPIDRRDPDPYLARDVQTAGGVDAAPLTAQIDHKERTMPISMSPECRWAMRATIAHAMDGAEMHAAMADLAPEGHRGAHREFALGNLKRADDLHKLYAAAFNPADADDEGVARTAPDLKDVELKARFAEVAATVGKLPRTPAMVLRQYAGTDKPDDAEVELMALRADRADLIVLRTAQKSAKKASDAEQREALIARYMEPGVAVITPADAKTMRGLDPATDAVVGDPWTPNRIEVFAQRRLASGGGPAADLIRTAPLRDAGGAAAAPTPGAAPLTPAATPAPAAPTAPSLVRVMSNRGMDVTRTAAAALQNVPGLTEDELRASMAKLSAQPVQGFAEGATRLAVQ